MPNLLIGARQIKGLLPALVSRNIDKPHIIQGRNFLIDTKGPKASFYSRFVSHSVISNPIDAVTFRLEDDTDLLLVTSSGFLKYDTASQTFYPVFVPSVAITEYYPWSMAKVGNDYFFAHKGLGTRVIKYASLADIWSEITTDVLTGVRSVCASQGRLVILSEDWVQWSAQDDGTDLTASAVTGAGAFGLNISGGKGLRVMDAADGFICYTSTGGVLKGDVSTGISPFRVYSADTRQKLINPYCCIQLEDGINLILTARGFQVTANGKFEPWQQLMGEYLTNTVLPNLDLTVNTVIKLHFNSDRKLLFVSLGADDSPTLYQRALVLYLPVDEWGSFDELHYGFGELMLNAGPDVGYNFGFFCVNGYLHRFVKEIFRERALTEEWYHYRTVLDMPPVRVGTKIIWQANVRLTAHDEADLTGLASGVYGFSYTEYPADPSDVETGMAELDAVNGVTVSDYMTNGLANEDWLDVAADTFEDWLDAYHAILFPANIQMAIGWNIATVVLYAPASYALPAYIEVGLLRFSEQKFNDELSMITNLSIGMDASPGEPFFLDYMDVPDGLVVDYETSTAADEDWGYMLLAAYDYDITVRGTLDGINTWDGQEKIPELVNDAGDQQFYSTDPNGLFHIVRLSAEEVSQTFHLKFLEASGMLTGRL